MDLAFSNISAVVLGAFAMTVPALTVPAFAQDAAPKSCDCCCFSSITSTSGADQRPDTQVTAQDSQDSNALDSSALADMLTFDPARLTVDTPLKSVKRQGLSDSQKFTVTRSERPDGSSIVTVKQPLSDEWNANVGVDLGIGANSTDAQQPGRIETKDGSSGAAWASVGITNFATINARVDPAHEQSRLGATLKQSLAIGGQAKVTFQDTHSVIENLGIAADAGPIASTNASQILGSQQTMKFDLVRTGTSMSASLNSTSVDPVTHKILSADQKLAGPLHLTTSVTDAGQPTANKSIAARLKLNW